MKLVRYGQPGKEKPGLIDAAGKLRDLSGVVSDIGPEQLSDNWSGPMSETTPLKSRSLPAASMRPGFSLPG